MLPTNTQLLPNRQVQHINFAVRSVHELLSDPKFAAEQLLKKDRITVDPQLLADTVKDIDTMALRIISLRPGADLAKAADEVFANRPTGGRKTLLLKSPSEGILLTPSSDYAALRETILSGEILSRSASVELTADLPRDRQRFLEFPE